MSQLEALENKPSKSIQEKVSLPYLDQLNALKKTPLNMSQLEALENKPSKSIQEKALLPYLEQLNGRKSNTSVDMNKFKDFENKPSKSEPTALASTSLSFFLSSFDSFLALELLSLLSSESLLSLEKLPGLSG
jgi:hypothetical protein